MGAFCRAFLAHYLVLVTTAQTESSPTCDDIDRYLPLNASITRPFPALGIQGTNGSRPGIGNFEVVNDTSREWSVKLAVSTKPGETRISSPRLFLETGNSSLTQMGACHQFIQPSERLEGFRWPKSVLERSLKDTGDCKVMLGEECVAAIKQAYKRRAVANMVTGECSVKSQALPWPCAGPMPFPDCM